MKNILKNKKILIIPIALVLLIGIVVTVILMNKYKLTDLEKVMIEDASSKVENYLDEIVLHDDNEGKYINYAIEYLYNETDDSEYTMEAILNVINTTFNIEYTEEDIAKAGITREMVDKGIVFNSTNNTFKYNAIKTPIDISNTPIVKYGIKNIKKKSNSEFEVTYEKYVVENPYEIYNYYNNKNNELAEGEKKYDTKDIVSYLKGEKKIGIIKKEITKDNISNYGKIEKGPKVTYILKDGNLVIDKIK